VQRLKRVLKWAGVGLLGVVAALAIVLLLLPKGPRDPMEWDDPWHKERDLVVATRYVVAAGTPWATDAAASVLKRGGNAFDAAVAALLVLNVTHSEASSFPGVAPLMIYDARAGEVRSYIGVGKAPRAATLERFRAAGYKVVPDLHIWSQLVPASPDVLFALLTDRGTMSFGELARPAIEIAREGFPVHHIMARNLDFSLPQRLGFSYLLPYNAQVYLQGEWWRPVHEKDRLRQPDLASTLDALARAEQGALARGADRAAALRAARSYFYEGPIARAIVEMHERESGLITADDLAGYSGAWEAPVVASYGDYTIYTNGPWNQGILVPMALKILEPLDVRAMGHDSPAYVHAVTQALELAMADREAYIGDPAFVDVPVPVLVSDGYAARQRARMTEAAFGALPAPGDVGSGHPRGASRSAPPEGTAGAGTLPAPKASSGLTVGKDTSQIAVIDAEGNAVVLTPSDFPKSPMLPGYGINLGNRMVQFRLEPEHPSALAPGKRPRITPHAVIVFRGGRFYMAYSTPGGDMQAQALVQVFLNHVVFGMNIKDAIAAPRFQSMSAPSSFSPHEAHPGELWMEETLYEKVAGELAAKGYKLRSFGGWDNQFGAVGAVIRDGDRLLAGSDPREEGTAAGE
jgi:gamma-glutamyltranspeptidase / glutathione hydrolase